MPSGDHQVDEAVGEGLDRAPTPSCRANVAADERRAGQESDVGRKECLLELVQKKPLLAPIPIVHGEDVPVGLLAKVAVGNDHVVKITESGTEVAEDVGTVDHDIGEVVSENATKVGEELLEC